MKSFNGEKCKVVIATLLTCVIIICNSMIVLAASVPDDYYENADIREVTITSDDGTNWDISASDDMGDYVFADFYGTVTPVYCVDISWGNMEFRYTKTGDWDTTKHIYPGNWTIGHGADNNVTVANHSNVPLNVEVHAQLNKNSNCNVTGEIVQVADTTIDDITDITTTSKALNPSLTLPIDKCPVGEGTTAPVVTAELNIAGAINEEYKTQAQIGLITITITP